MLLIETGLNGNIRVPRLLDGNGTNPFRLVSCPTVIPPQVLLWASTDGPDDNCTMISASAASTYLMSEASRRAAALLKVRRNNQVRRPPRAVGSRPRGNARWLLRRPATRATS